MTQVLIDADYFFEQISDEDLISELEKRKILSDKILVKQLVDVYKYDEKNFFQEFSRIVYKYTGQII